MTEPSTSAEINGDIYEVQYESIEVTRGGLIDAVVDPIRVFTQGPAHYYRNGVEITREEFAAVARAHSVASVQIVDSVQLPKLRWARPGRQLADALGVDEEPFETIANREIAAGRGIQAILDAFQEEVPDMTFEQWTSAVFALGYFDGVRRSTWI